MIILYSIKGRVGQLLSFKSILPKYRDVIDEFVGDIDLDTTTTVFETEEIPVEAEAIPSVPVKTIEREMFSRNVAYYREIYPIVSKKLKESAKFSLTISIILNYSNGENSFLDIFDKMNISKYEYISEIYKLYKSNKIKIPDYELFQFNCPKC